MPLYDAHNHLQDEWLLPYIGRLAPQLEDLRLGGCVVNGTKPSDWEAVAVLSRTYPWARPSFGIHPWEVGNCPPGWEPMLRSRLLECPKSAVGEIGLDRWILERARRDDPRLVGLRRASLDEQSSVFIKQLQIAAELERAATLHCIDAWGLLLAQLQSTTLPRKGFLLHAYAGPVEMVHAFADLGAYFSFNGAFLDPRKRRQRETFKQVPPDRLLVETDAPAMPPPHIWCTHRLREEPKANHPGNIDAGYTGLAALLGVARSTLETSVEANFKRLFG